MLIIPEECFLQVKVAFFVWIQMCTYMHVHIQSGMRVCVCVFMLCVPCTNGKLAPVCISSGRQLVGARVISGLKDKLLDEILPRRE